MTRESELLDLARAGVSLDVIAQRVGYRDAESAREALAEALRRSSALATDDVAVLLEWDRLDRLHVAVWPKAMKGDVQAVEQALRIGDRRRQIKATLVGGGTPGRRAAVATGPRPGFQSRPD